MASHTKIGFILVIGLLFTALLTIKFHPSKAGQAESEKIASTVPIADLHMHDGFGMSRGKETGVVWGGLGSKRGERFTWMSHKELFGDKLIAWAGQAEFNDAYYSGGMAEMLNPDNPILKELYEDSEMDLKDGMIVGIGEIFINNRTSTPIPGFSRKGQVVILPH